MPSKDKINTVKELTKVVSEYPIVGIVNLNNLPTPQSQEMRALLRGKVLLKTTKKRLIKIIFNDLNAKKANINKLNEHLKGIPALLLTKENPFKLYKILKQNRSAAFAKTGQTAIKDIWVKAGPTNFAPGPVIGELSALGIKAGVDKGKIAIKEDKLLVKDGEVINDKVASMLTRLNIKPMEIGLDLVAVYENGTIYDKHILSVDDTEYINALALFEREAVNLSFNIGFYTKETMPIFIINAEKNAKNLAINGNVLTKDTVGNMISKAEIEAKSVKDTAKITE